MRCVLCRVLELLGTKIFPDDRTFQTDVVRQVLQSWRYAQTNDKEIYQHDPELDAIRDAERLAKDDPEASLLQFRLLAERGSV